MSDSVFIFQNNLNVQTWALSLFELRKGQLQNFFICCLQEVWKSSTVAKNELKTLTGGDKVQILVNV